MIKKKKGPNILFFDIETTPNLAYVWGKYQQDVIQYDKEWELLCFAWKWGGEKRVRALGQRDFKNEEELVKSLWELFDQADIIVAHNGDAFDIKKSNAKFLEFGLNPPSGYQTIDTVKVARKYFKFNSNRLNDLCQLLKLGQKVPTGGFDLWLGCMKGDRAAWRKMLEYNKKDVVLLEKAYLKMRNWMTNHPNTNLYRGTTHSCPNCGSGNLHKRGYSMTRVGKRERFQCQDCAAWSQGSIIKTGVIIR